LVRAFAVNASESPASSFQYGRLQGQVVAELAHIWGGTTATVRHIFSDPQGSPAFQVVGQASTQLGFFPYGKRMGDTPPAQNFSQLGYTGHRQDDDLGLINMNGRVYDVARRRFLTRDTVPDQPFTTFGTQPYSYVAHNPTNLVDPSGFAANAYPGDSRDYVRSAAENQGQQQIPCQAGRVCVDVEFGEPVGCVTNGAGCLRSGNGPQSWCCGGSISSGGARLRVWKRERGRAGQLQLGEPILRPYPECNATRLASRLAEVCCRVPSLEEDGGPRMRA
jgi:RHS repeat-associated protein